MAICGFNNKIGSGLALLFEGMADSLAEKARNVTTEGVIWRELIELENIISVLKTDEGNTLAEMFVGLNLLARSMFSKVQIELRTDGIQELKDECMQVGYAFIELLASTESKNSEIPLDEHSEVAIASRARRLAQWALEKSRTDTPDRITLAS